MSSQPFQRRHPRISVNKLSEYISTPYPLRRRKIIKDQRSPSEFVTALYQPVRLTLKEYYLDTERSSSILQRSISALRRARPKETQWTINRRLNCVEALEGFIGKLDAELSLAGYCTEAGGSKVPKLPIGGVQVSVRPELILRRKDRKGNQVLGAVKFNISKTYRLTKETASYIGVVLQRYLSDHVAGSTEVVQSRHCLIIDVFDGMIYRAPQHSKQRFGQIEAACQEIGLLWNQE